MQTHSPFIGVASLPWKFKREKRLKWSICKNVHPHKFPTIQYTVMSPQVQPDSSVQAFTGKQIVPGICYHNRCATKTKWTCFQECRYLIPQPTDWHGMTEAHYQDNMDILPRQLDVTMTTRTWYHRKSRHGWHIRVTKTTYTLRQHGMLPNILHKMRDSRWHLPIGLLPTLV